MRNNLNKFSRIDPSHNSHNALDKHPTMHHFVKEMCTCTCVCAHAHVCTFLLQNGALWDMGLVHCGICSTTLLEKQLASIDGWHRVKRSHLCIQNCDQTLDSCSIWPETIPGLSHARATGIRSMANCNTVVSPLYQWRRQLSLALSHQDYIYHLINQ